MKPKQDARQDGPQTPPKVEPDHKKQNHKVRPLNLTVILSGVSENILLC